MNVTFTDEAKIGNLNKLPINVLCAARVHVFLTMCHPFSTMSLRSAVQVNDGRQTKNCDVSYS
jgi:hypothetical protein